MRLAQSLYIFYCVAFFGVKFHGQSKIHVCRLWLRLQATVVVVQVLCWIWVQPPHLLHCHLLSSSSCLFPHLTVPLTLSPCPTSPSPACHLSPILTCPHPPSSVHHCLARPLPWPRDHHCPPSTPPSITRASLTASLQHCLSCWTHRPSHHPSRSISHQCCLSHRTHCPSHHPSRSISHQRRLSPILLEIKGWRWSWQDSVIPNCRTKNNMFSVSL